MNRQKKFNLLSEIVGAAAMLCFIAAGLMVHRVVGVLVVGAVLLVYALAFHDESKKGDENETKS